MQKKWTKTVVGLGGASVIALSGAALSSAQSTGAAAPSSPQEQTARPAQGHAHGTPVDAKTLASLQKAVAAKDAGVKIERAFKAVDGSFHAAGTKAGKRVHVEANAAMTTVTVRQGGPGMHDGHGHDGRGHLRGTEVTGAKRTSVTKAITAKDAGVTVEKVFQGPQGEFHAAGTKAGKRVMIQVSKDLGTVTVMTGGPGRGAMGHQGQHGGQHAGEHGPSGAQGAANSTNSANPAKSPAAQQSPASSASPAQAA